MLVSRLPNRFYELYGLTEGFVTVLTNDMLSAKPNSVGIPPPLCTVEILDEQGNKLGPGKVGEICGKSPLVMTGYYNDKKNTQATFRGKKITEKNQREFFAGKKYVEKIYKNL